ncbi:MAG: c-type cytochrome biogenesis protein CcmI [Rhizobiaceae bacterium]
MLFWILCALLTFAAVAAVLYPYLSATSAKPDASDLEVYKDQLKEIDADEKRGIISSTEAVNARVEVSRRILRADDLRKAIGVNESTSNSKLLLMCAALSVPIVSWGLYAAIGAPNMPDQPIAARLNVAPADASMEVLVAKAEAHLAANPNDGRGWGVIAPIYLRVSRFEDAVRAFQMAGKLNGPAAAYEIGIGQALIGMNGGRTNDQARAAFKRAVDIDPANPEPKLLLATDLAQQGKFPEAKAAFEAMLASAPADAPWRGMLIDMIARVDTAMSAKASQQAPGPSQTDVDQASQMSDADRSAMIEGMVAQLDAKLVADPSDVEGWKRLMQSYLVLNKPEKAREALERAKAGLKSNPVGLEQVNAFAVQLGIIKP